MSVNIQVKVPSITNTASFTIDTTVKSVNITTPTISQNITIVIFSA